MERTRETNCEKQKFKKDEHWTKILHRQPFFDDFGRVCRKGKKGKDEKARVKGARAGRERERYVGFPSLFFSQTEKTKVRRCSSYLQLRWWSSSQRKISKKDEEISIPLNSSSFLLSNFVLLALPMLSLPSPIKGQIISPLSSGKAKKKGGGV